MTDKNSNHEAERRRNGAMNDFIRQGTTAPSMPLDPSAFTFEEPEAPAAPPEPRPPRSIDAGAGVGGPYIERPPSMNDQLRAILGSGPPGRRNR
jgi:hypothetical protein